jgi:hypothetical protein
LLPAVGQQGVKSALCFDDQSLLDMPSSTTALFQRLRRIIIRRPRSAGL